MLVASHDAIGYQIIFRCNFDDEITLSMIEMTCAFGVFRCNFDDKITLSMIEMACAFGIYPMGEEGN